MKAQCDQSANLEANTFLCSSTIPCYVLLVFFGISFLCNFDMLFGASLLCISSVSLLCVCSVFFMFLCYVFIVLVFIWWLLVVHF